MSFTKVCKRKTTAMQVHTNQLYDPQNYPTKMSGKLTHKIIIKKDYVRTDGTCALYIQLFLDGKRKRLPLNIFVAPKMWNEKKQILKGSSDLTKDYNLVIGKKLAGINRIAVSYRLAGIYLTFEKLIEDLTDPSSKVDFIKFCEKELEKQKEVLAKGTYRQQLSTITKIKKFKDQILFQDINEDLINELIIYCKKNLKNKNTTIQTTLKNFKKFLHIANKKGIRTELKFDDITIKSFKGDRTFLTSEEIKTLYEYRESKFISESRKNIVDRFLFSCFTGLRISDIRNLSNDNFIGDFIAFKSEKTGKFQKIKLNESAKKFINESNEFNGDYTNEHINRELKSIVSSCGIKKRVTFHVARHSFATNYLIKGGGIQNLQKVLGHSNIRETMIYVHIVDSIINEEINNMDDIIN
ncbi:site-specific integrase [Tenacibaculum sp. Bg11-29]|uniref:site-specific integrase n=1 Tax=Tenacibaculum sp. Bg11-29 TaxID=2058306 RepID=UPI0012FF2219|nr:site-specific integrase [Tenacibaculum sp. Bg11-29]